MVADFAVDFEIRPQQIWSIEIDGEWKKYFNLLEIKKLKFNEPRNRFSKE